MQHWKKIKSSTGPYRSCAALLNISNFLKDLLEFGLVLFVLVGFSLVWLVLFCLVEFSLVWKISFHWVWLRMVWLGLVWFGSWILIWFYQVQIHMADFWFILVAFGVVWCGLVWFGLVVQFWFGLGAPRSSRLPWDPHCPPQLPHSCIPESMDGEKKKKEKKKINRVGYRVAAQLKNFS